MAVGRAIYLVLLPFPISIVSWKVRVVLGGVMRVDNIDRLTAAQKACLRLVFRQKSSKDIAKQLGTSPHTVDNHIKSAIQKLSVKNRGEAALLLAEYEEIFQRRELASQLPVLSPDTVSRPSPVEPAEGDLAGGGLGSTDSLWPILENRPAASTAQPGLRLPFPRHWGEPNDMSGAQKLLWVVALAIAMCIGIGAVVSTMEALSRII